MNCCYKGNIYDFLKTNKSDWLKEMMKNFLAICHEKASELQIMAWEDCYYHMKVVSEKLNNKSVSLIFEYELPHEGGRRPDVILLSDTVVLVIEFKMKETFRQEDIDQVRGYKRDIKNYHKYSHEYKVLPILIPTMAINKSTIRDGVEVYSPDLLSEAINNMNLAANEISIENWLQSPYEPLPSLVQAAKLIFNEEPLPFIRKANSAGIPEAVEYMKSITEYAKSEHKKILVLVTGVPGAGKTLLGLQYVYESSSELKKDSVFLSGNGPLVTVIQDALKSKVFVQPLRNYVKQHGINAMQPTNHIVVFDEAQRAWDKDLVEKKHGLCKSEPDLLIDIGDRILEWTVQLGLIGEGQEIYKGEEAGIEQWKTAISNSQEAWEVFCPEKLEHLFKDIVKVTTNEFLNLDISLRSHIAEDVSNLVENVIDEKLDEARTKVDNISESGFDLYVTRDLERAKRYCRRRYEGNSQKRYGLLASSRDRSLRRFGVDNSYNASKSLNVGAWYNDDPTSQKSCCQLDSVVTEFQCQGLEVDLPIVCWGDDFLWEDGIWKSYNSNQDGYKDPHQLRKNSYRVLLTRGRDGMVIFIPNDKRFNSVFDMFKGVNLREL